MPLFMPGASPGKWLYVNPGMCTSSVIPFPGVYPYGTPPVGFGAGPPSFFAIFFLGLLEAEAEELERFSFLFLWLSFASFLALWDFPPASASLTKASK